MRRSPLVAALAAICLSTACGSTVPLAGRSATGGTQDGLSSQPPGTSSQLGAQAPGTTTGTGAVPSGSGGSGCQGSSQQSGSTGGQVSGTSTSGSTSGGTATSTTGTTPAAPPAGAKITTPITIGYLGAASSAGVNAALGTKGGTQETPQDALAYLIKGLNAQGGLNGRKIIAVSSFIDPTSTNYDTQASAACANFTQDHHVAVVLAQEDFYYSENFSSCLSRARVPEVEAITGGVDAATLAKYPMMLSVSAPTVARRFTAMIKGLTANGYLTPKNKIGVIVEDCPYNVSTYSSTIGPMLKNRGLNVTMRSISCVHGFGDAAAFIAASGNQVLPLAAAKVDRVMFVTGFEQIAATYFEQQAHQQGYAPHYALTSTADAGENGMGFSPAALARVQGVGWQPDLDSLALVTNSTATTRCRALFKGFAPAADRLNHRLNEYLCELFFSYEAALKGTNGNSDGKAITASFLRLGTTYTSPLSLSGATSYGPGHKDGPRLFATFGYKPSCSCIGYTGSPEALA